jgi:hypothetical protein
VDDEEHAGDEELEEGEDVGQGARCSRGDVVGGCGWRGWRGIVECLENELVLGIEVGVEEQRVLEDVLELGPVLDERGELCGEREDRAADGHSSSRSRRRSSRRRGTSRRRCKHRGRRRWPARVRGGLVWRTAATAAATAAVASRSNALQKANSGGGRRGGAAECEAASGAGDGGGGRIVRVRVRRGRGGDGGRRGVGVGDALEDAEDAGGQAVLVADLAPERGPDEALLPPHERRHRARVELCGRGRRRRRRGWWRWRRGRAFFSGGGGGGGGGSSSGGGAAEASAPGLDLERVGLEADVGVFHPACSLRLAAGGWRRCWGECRGVEEVRGKWRGEARRSWFVVKLYFGRAAKRIGS